MDNGIFTETELDWMDSHQDLVERLNTVEGWQALLEEDSISYDFCSILLFCHIYLTEGVKGFIITYHLTEDSQFFRARLYAPSRPWEKFIVTGLTPVNDPATLVESIRSSVREGFLEALKDSRRPGFKAVVDKVIFRAKVAKDG